MYIGESERQARSSCLIACGVRWEVCQTKLCPELASWQLLRPQRCYNHVLVLHIHASAHLLLEGRMVVEHCCKRVCCAACETTAAELDRCGRYLSGRTVRGRACSFSTSWTAWRRRAGRAPTAAASWTALSVSCWRRSMGSRLARTCSSLERPTGSHAQIIHDA